MKIRVRDLATVGLPEEGIYKLDIEGGRSTEGVGKTSGNPYEKVTLNFRIDKRDDGTELPHRPFVFEDFMVSYDWGLERFLNVYAEATGDLPDTGAIDPATGEPSVDTSDLMEDLFGRSVWGIVLYDTEQRADSGRYKLKLGRNFSSDPARLRMPKRTSVAA